MYNEEYIVAPAKITDNETGKTYELDFSRESVRFAEARGFELENLSKFPNTTIPEFFFYSFRKNSKNVPRAQTDKILEKMDGIPPKLFERLIELFMQARTAHIIATDEDEGKNSMVTVEL